MGKQKFIYRSAKLAGILLMVATALHATFGTAEVLTAITVGDIKPAMINTVRNVWLFSSIMLFLSATWVLFLAKDLGRLRRRAWWQAVLIGLGYVGGSAVAMQWSGLKAHLLAFAMIGLLLLLPALVFAGSFKADPSTHQ